MAVNPHAETYQGKTQFSGPVKAGTRWEGPNADFVGKSVAANPFAVSKLANAGYVVCSQSAAVEQLTGAPPTVSDITLPPGSMIISIQYIVTAAFTGSVKDLELLLDPGGSSGGGSGIATYLTPNGPGPTVDAVGVYNIGPKTAGVDDVTPWINISDPTYVPGATAGVSLDVLHHSTNAGTGRAIVTINYIPEFNYPLA